MSCFKQCLFLSYHFSIKFFCGNDRLTKKWLLLYLESWEIDSITHINVKWCGQSYRLAIFLDRPSIVQNFHIIIMSHPENHNIPKIYAYSTESDNGWKNMNRSQKWQCQPPSSEHYIQYVLKKMSYCIIWDNKHGMLNNLKSNSRLDWF